MMAFSLSWIFLVITSGFHVQPSTAQQTTTPNNATMFYNIVEKLPSGVFVASIVNDAKLEQKFDQNTINLLQFEVLKGSFKEYFMIESPSGLLKTRKVIDRDTLCYKQLTCVLGLDVAIIKPAQKFQVFKLEVTIIDVNDNSPRFDPPTLTLSVSESALPSTIIVLHSAQDLDSGIFDVQNYSFRCNSSKFDLQVIENLDGPSDLQLLVKDKLDREVEGKYTATISAVDGGSPAKSGTLEITILVQDANDNSPVFEKAFYNASVREDFPINGIILWVRATDVDEGINSEIVYSFALQTQVASGDTFSIDSSRGDISLKQALDFEKESAYTLVVVASDRGPDSVPVYAKVVITVEDLNDNAPVVRMNAVDNNGFATVAENEQILSFVAHISAEDADSGVNGEVNCELLHGSGFGLQQLFPSEFKLVTTTVFDREEADQYLVTILCHDNGIPSLSTSKDLIVKVTDVNDNHPQFDRKDYAAILREGNAPGVPLLRVNATDADSGPNAVVEFKLCPNSKRLVAIDNSTGLITASVVFDYEKVKDFQFCVIVTDHGSTRLSSTAIVTLTVVDVNDESPAFGQASYNFGTYENQSPNSEIGTVSAVDADSPPYDKFVFSIMMQTPETNSFSIDPYTGRITTTKILDREAHIIHYLVIAATNDAFPSHSSTANVTIYVADKNDNAPNIDYPTRDNNTVEISCFSPLGYIFTRIYASDADSGMNAILSYSIIKGNRENLFDIDPVSGAVSVNKDLRELQERKMHRLIISVSDAGVPPKSAEVTLNIWLSSSPELANQVQQSSFGFDLTSHRSILIIVGSITAVLVAILVTSIVCIKWRQMLYRRKFHGYWRGRTTPSGEESRYLNIGDCYTSIKDRQLQAKSISSIYRDPQFASPNRKNVHFDLGLDISDLSESSKDIASHAPKFQRSCNIHPRIHSHGPDGILQNVTVHHPVTIPENIKAQVNHGLIPIIKDAADSDSTSGCSTDMSNSDGGRGHCECCTLSHQRLPALDESHHETSHGAVHQLDVTDGRLSPDADQTVDSGYFQQLENGQHFSTVVCSRSAFQQPSDALLQSSKQQQQPSPSSSCDVLECHSQQDDVDNSFCSAELCSPSSSLSENTAIAYISEVKQDIRQQSPKQKPKPKPTVPPRNTSLKPK